MEQSNFSCKIFVDEDEIYSGNFSEVPQKFRNRIIDDISEWAECLGKSGTNELLYSHLIWYHEKGLYCESCEGMIEEAKIDNCTQCQGELKEQFVYERSSEIDKILTCIGMISRIEVIK
ncbi:MAG: hypothetical protein AAF462_07710 [Thermodesulfobacteriota bacterium]